MQQRSLDIDQNALKLNGKKLPLFLYDIKIPWLNARN